MDFIDLRPGNSVEGAKIPGHRSDIKGPRYIYLIAGTHGDEVEGVFVLQKLFDWLKEAEGIDLPLVVVPILNVDGYRAQTRVNSHGVDLNRNYPSEGWTEKARAPKYYPGKAPLSEPENVYLDKLFSKFPPKLIISFHSWKPMLNYNGECQDIAEFLQNYNNYPVVDDIKGHPTPGSLGEYAPSKHRSPVLTFECPVLSEEISLNDIWEENKAGLYKLMESDLLKNF